MTIAMRSFLASFACALGLAARAPLAIEAPTLDCNANGVEDAVDIALGSSSDVDLDGIPDECQVASDVSSN